jgi:hypothetical protein
MSMKLKPRSNKFQNVHFNSIEEFLDYLPKRELEMVEALRRLIFDCIPQCTEKLSYNVPFYSKHSGICFIWPASVPWGKVQTEGVRFGFQRGHLLNDEMRYLDKGTRKQVFCKDFMRLEEIGADIDVLKYFLFEAANVDTRTAVQKRRRASI